MAAGGPSPFAYPDFEARAPSRNIGDGELTPAAARQVALAARFILEHGLAPDRFAPGRLICMVLGILLVPERELLIEVAVGALRAT